MPKLLFADQRTASRRRPELQRRGTAGFGKGPVVAAVVLASLSAVLACPLGAQTPVTAGYRDFSFGSTAIATPTGEKPESKLWWNDGAWWGVLFSAAANQYHIYQFNAGTQAWTDTGTPVDNRKNSKADALWDQPTGRLYVVSHVFTTSGKTSTSSSQWGRLYRYTYDTAGRRYTLDAGFPLAVTRGIEETLTIAKDSVQRLWITYVEAGRVKVNWSRAHDLDWGSPVDLPAPSTAISVNSDDISAVVAFGGAYLGVMWSNQNRSETYFAFRNDTDAPEVWQPVETVLPGSGCAGACSDDHFNLKTDQSGRVFAATKTSLTASSSPLAMLAVRSPGTPGAWTSYPIGLKSDHHTRPIVLLDEQNNRVYVFATSGESGGTIYMKSSPLDDISFPTGLGTPFIKSASDTTINNATSTKQNVSGTTGLLVAASDQNTRFYLHGHLELDGGAVVDPPAAPAGLAATPVSSARVDLAWTDASVNEDSFSIERATGGGAFAAIGTTAANVASFSDTTALPATSYIYRVRARNTAGFSGYSNTADATTPAAPGGGGGGGGTSSPIKSITFEAGSLSDPTTGADKVVGAVALESAAPLKGSYSARIPNAASTYLEENFTSTDDLYVSLYIRLNALPAADARILLVSNAGTTVGNIVVRTTGRLRLRADATTIGAESTPLQVGQIYRLAIHQKRGSGGNGILEAFLATGDQAFGLPFASTTAGAWVTAADRIRAGATNPNAIDLAVDDIRLDASAMPGV